MTLELTINADNITDTFRNNQTGLRHALEFRTTPHEERPDLSANFYVNPLVRIGFLGYSFFSDVQSAVSKYSGKENVEELVQRAADTALSLVSYLTAGKDEMDIGALAVTHIEQLQDFCAFYNALAESYEQLLAEVSESNMSILNEGIKGLARLVVRSNLLYNPDTRELFLSNVTQSDVDEEYETGLLRELGVPGIQ